MLQSLHKFHFEQFFSISLNSYKVTFNYSPILVCLDCLHFCYFKYCNLHLFKKCWLPLWIFNLLGHWGNNFLQAKIAVEAQNKYERELMLHAADVEALQAAKEQVSKMASVRQHLEETTQKAESQLLECKASWEERERMLKVLLYVMIECSGELKGLVWVFLFFLMYIRKTAITIDSWLTG